MDGIETDIDNFLIWEKMTMSTTEFNAWRKQEV